MSLYETLTWLVFSHVLIVSSEASISALILFPPFARCFLERGLPVAMQNILALSYCFPECDWIQIINHSKMIPKKIMRKKGWIMKVNRKLSFELKLLKEVKHKLKKKKMEACWKCPLNVPWIIQLPKRKWRECHLRVLWEGSTALRRWHYCCESAWFTSPRALSAALLQYLSKKVIALELGRSRAARIISFEICHRERLKEFSLVQHEKTLCNKLIEVSGAINKLPGMIWEQKNHRKIKLLRKAEYNT